MKVHLIDAHMFPQYDFSIERGIMEAEGHEFVVNSCKTEEEIVEKCADADAILDVYTHMTEKSLGRLPRCQVIVRYGIGYDSIDLPAATAHGIKVCNIPHYSIPEVAVHTTALILAAARNLFLYTQSVRAGKYSDDAKRFPVMHRPSARIVGLIGLGNIGRAVAKNMQAIGYQVEAYDPYLEESVFEELGVKKVTREELFRTADILSFHTHYNAETHHMVNAETLAMMKDGVIIVNTARGPMICEEDLLAALRSGKVAAAGLDVYETEPFRPADHPFYHMDNVILTPHAAYASAESTLELYRQVALTAAAVLRGELPYNIVNKKALGL